MTRTVSLLGRLSRLGFEDSERAINLWHDPLLQKLLANPGDQPPPWFEQITTAPSPDDALLTLVRLAERIAEQPTVSPLWARITQNEDAIGKFFAVAGGSGPLADEIVRYPESLLAVFSDDEMAIGADARQIRAELLRAVKADPNSDMPVATVTGKEGIDAMRQAYRRRLIRIAAADLTSQEPLTLLPAVAAALADLAAAALEAALAWSRSELPDEHDQVKLAVIGMGKTGGRELNYVSDVDVIYVVEANGDVAENDVIRIGTKLATGLAHACQGSAGEPPLWPVDAALRPEGKQGQLVRTLPSHVSYYERWAKTWEFQALLKARPVAGDLELGRAYRQAIEPFVWQAVRRENFVEDSRAMRRRVEDNVPAAEAERQIKLGKGGLRDVEFTVQLLQLVHGRADESIRSANTLTALAALSAGGYVGRADASQLSVCYRFLRVLEHRIQLSRLRRTHLMPTAEAELHKLARAAGMRLEGVKGLQQRWKSTRREVRALHEELFYRPLLPAVAQLSADEVRLTPDAARERLGAMGYRDPAGALRHIDALTEGLSRRAAIQRQLLPVMLGWFAQGADPDRGLLAFRKLSDELGSAHWYLKLLRDSTSAATRLAKVLSNSQFMADQLARSAESVHWLGDDEALVPLSYARLREEVHAVVARASDEQSALLAVRAIRRRELTRTATGELLDIIDPVRVQRAIATVTDVCLEAGLGIATRSVMRELAVPEPLVDFLIVAMGRLGGREMGYGSDADVMYVYQARPGVSDGDAQRFATVVAQRLQNIMAKPDREPAMMVDADLRPEGRNGPLARSFASYREYYQRWVDTWERQALLRARVVAGPQDLAQQFVDLIEPLRYPGEGLDQASIREIRRIKARVESERLPRGVTPQRHLKLGPGAIADVEWTVQLLQLEYAGRFPQLRRTETLATLVNAAQLGFISEHDAQLLQDAWQLAAKLRAGVVLWSGRTTGQATDVLPADRRDLTGLSQTIGFLGHGSELEDHYIRTTRRARAVVERVFYGLDGSDESGVE